ncbi:MAG TPA: hypothetical protein VK929_08575 [Longimicrobiales bacterium]|nr:hypothetical protein [Longimicrobiales bacterium]
MDRANIMRRRSFWTPFTALAILAGCSDLAGPDAAGFPLIVEVDIPVAQQQVYEEDAVRLAIRELRQSGSRARHDVEPPAALVQGLFNSLAAVYATSHAARDSVVEIFGIRTFPYPATREIMVRVNPSHSWTQAWREKNALTGNAAVDALVTQYGLTVREYYLWSIGDVALLRSARPLNAAALAQRFEALAGVVWAEENGAMGDGNDIRASRHGDGWRLDYSVGFGDCPAGCIDRHTWSFAVAADGGVTFLGASGPPVPPPYSAGSP